MAIVEKVKGVKVVVRFEKGSQTVGNCSKTATAAQLYALTEAVEGIIEGAPTDRIKVTETILVNA